jgi:hypothetical protein
MGCSAAFEALKGLLGSNMKWLLGSNMKAARQYMKVYDQSYFGLVELSWL